MSTTSPLDSRHNDATLWVGNLDERVTDDLLFELFTQIGKVVKVSMVAELNIRYAFIEFEYEEEVEYAMKIMKWIKLYGREMKLNYNRPKESTNKDNTSSSSTLESNIVSKNIDVGANLHVGGLDEDVTEDELLNAFSSFGNIIRTPHIAVNDSGASLGHAFISYDSFEASDLAIECMNQQYFRNRTLNVQYAFKKGGGMKKERHGSLIERRLAKKTVKAQFKQHHLFAERPGEVLQSYRGTTSAMSMGTPRLGTTANGVPGVPPSNSNVHPTGSYPTNLPPPVPALHSNYYTGGGGVGGYAPPPQPYYQPYATMAPAGVPPILVPNTYGGYPSNQYAPPPPPAPYGSNVPPQYSYPPQQPQQHYNQPPPPPPAPR